MLKRRRPSSEGMARGSPPALEHLRVVRVAAVFPKGRIMMVFGAHQCSPPALEHCFLGLWAHCRRSRFRVFNGQGSVYARGYYRDMIGSKCGLLGLGAAARRLESYF